MWKNYFDEATLERAQDILLVLFGLAATVSVMGVGFAHLADRFRVDHVAGAWMALTHYAQDGIFYPPLFDGERFGGTRFMPLSLLVNLAFAVVGNDLIVSGKMASAVSALLLLVTAARVFSSVRAGAAMTMALVGWVAVTEPFWEPSDEG